MATAFTDDKSPIVIPFILSQIKEHQDRSDAPFFIGLNGVQGVGKTTLVTALETTLRSPPYNLPTSTLSIDDLYLPRSAQVELAASHPHNPLIQHRGEPSTHDMTLGLELFRALKSRASDIRIPSYDKSLHNGKGDRLPETAWRVVNSSGEKPVEVVIFEGWCVGFRSLSHRNVEEKWKRSRDGASKVAGQVESRLAQQTLENVQFVNDALQRYDELTDYLDAFVHIDALNTHYVYDWRLEQEARLRESRGTGMTDEQVVKFVDGYYPAYELFTDGLRAGVLSGSSGRQLHIVVKKDRKVDSHEIL